MKYCFPILAFAAVILSCQPATSPAGPVTVNGNWTWATIQGGAVSSLGWSGSMTVVDATTYTWNFTTQSSGTDSGSVALKSAGVYTFTSSSPGQGTPYDMTLGADGKTLSGTHPFFGAITFTK